MSESNPLNQMPAPKKTEEEVAQSNVVEFPKAEKRVLFEDHQGIIHSAADEAEAYQKREEMRREAA